MKASGRGISNLMDPNVAMRSNEWMDSGETGKSTEGIKFPLT